MTAVIQIAYHNIPRPRNHPEVTDPAPRWPLETEAFQAPDQGAMDPHCPPRQSSQL